MKKLRVRPFRTGDEDAVVRLWNDCGLVVNWNDPYRDIQRKAHVDPQMFLVGLLGDSLIATVMAGYEGHRGWINYLAVHPDHQRKGYAARMMEEAEKLLRIAGCPKINLQVRTSNTEVIEFYKQMGYSIDDCVSMGKRLESDE
jgi:ribosomal protein S18 acetylase RimI-like enzyme